MASLTQTFTVMTAVTWSSVSKTLPWSCTVHYAFDHSEDIKTL